MRETKFGAIQSPLQADLDRIAESVLDGLNVDMAIFSVTHNKSLVALGISTSVSRSKEGRVHKPAKLVCRQTMVNNAPVVIADARSDPVVSQIPVVREGIAVGYLSVPVHNAEIGAIGAICAVSSAPRTWSQADLRYLTAVSLTVENLVLREMYRLESTNASNLAAEYDQIISAFSIVRAEPTSIHDVKGGLVFANAALTEHVDDSELESTVVRRALLNIAQNSSAKLKVKSGVEFWVTRQPTSSGYHVCQWSFARTPLH